MRRCSKLSPAARLCTLAGLALASITSLALADQVILRDGTVYEGTIISETRRSIVIDTEVHGISTRMTLDINEILKVTKSEDMEDAEDLEVEAEGSDLLTIPTRSSEEESEEVEVLKREGYQLLMEIPLSGTFGQDIYPLSVADSLEWAKSRGVTDIVFRINSPGGEVWAAQDLVAVMERFSDDFTYHMLIEHAISASIWPSFWSSSISMAPGADFGGAVVYSTNETGSAEVDKKMTSIMASKLGSAAEANGHSRHLVQAMMLSEAEVYAYKDDGEWVLTNSKDGLPKGYETIDGPDTVLTLTTEQAARYGIVKALESKSLDAFAAANGIEKWDSAGEIGHELAADANEKCKRLRDRLTATITSFYADYADYGATNRISIRGAAMQSMKRHMGSYKRIMSQAEEMEMPSIVDGYENAIDVVFWENEIETNLARLRRYKRMGP